MIQSEIMPPSIPATDILRNIDKNNVCVKLDQINNLHPSLKFTIKEETDNSIAFTYRYENYTF